MKGISSEWVIIPKSKNNSEMFNNTFHFSREISIESLPMVSIVGKGLVVDLELLQKDLPDDSLGGHRIPKDFDFPVYNVGDPSYILVGVVEAKDAEPRASAHFVSASPPGGEIPHNATIVVTFDNAPTDVTVSAGTVTVTGKTATIAGPFTPGPLALTITWADGTQALNYTVIAPDTDPPTVTGGTVKDGDRDVDPENINADACIIVVFNEDVAGNIVLQTEAGDDVGWLGRVEGNEGKLELVKGREIGNDTTYVIVGRVNDAAGNTTEISVTFTTALAPFHIVAPENLIAAWSFNEGKGNAVLDSSGNGHHGRIDGDARWVNGVFGTALQFAGQGQEVVIENDIAFNFRESMTVTGWFYPNDIVTNRPLITKKGSFYIGFNHKGWLEFVIQPDDITSFNDWSFNHGLRKWYHFAVTLHRESTKFYRNGREVHWWVRENVPIAPSEADLVIGAGFVGIVDEVALYNRALTEHEIIEIMENGFAH